MRNPEYLEVTKKQIRNMTKTVDEFEQKLKPKRKGANQVFIVKSIEEM